MSVDPVEADADSGDSFNRYAYVGNNPYGYVDPDGRNRQDAWYQYGEKDFKDWVHKEKQAEGRRDNYTREELKKLREQWEAEDRPRGKGGKSSRGGSRRGAGGAANLGLLVRLNTWLVVIAAAVEVKPLNEGEDEVLEELRQEPLGTVEVGNPVPAPEKPRDTPSPEPDRKPEPRPEPERERKLRP